MKIHGKVFIITGAGSGMGRQLSLQLIAKGAMVAGVDLHKKPLHETLELSGGNQKLFFPIEHDITDFEQSANIISSIQSHFGQIDGIINNAGIIQPFIKIQDLPIEKIIQVMNVNFYGTVYLTKAVLPILLQRPEAHIVNISSMGGFLPVPGQSVYGASKAAVKLFTEGLYAELKNSSVRVSVVFPGAVATNISENSGVKIEIPAGEQAQNSSMQALPSETAAQIIIDGIQNDKLHILVGSDSKFLNFLYRLAPKYATDFITKKMQSLLK